MTKKCLGCGITLQNINKLGLGYCPKKISEANYCERCFKIIHYNKASVATLPKESSKIISIVNKNALYVFFLIDFLNINSETINKFKEINVPKTLIISKCDVIPKSIKLNRVSSYLKEEYGLDNEIIFISSTKARNLSSIINVLEKEKVNTAYVLGFTNSGKSTLINALYEKYTSNKSSITTSLIPNTTLDFINVLINDNLTLIDSPGFILNNSLYKNDDIALIKRINPKNYLKPITFQCNKLMYLNIEDKIILKINSNNNNSLTFYLSNELNIKKSFKSTLKEFNLQLEVKDDSDIVIKGLGFINVKKATTIEAFIAELSLIEVRESIFKGSNINE